MNVIDTLNEKLRERTEDALQLTRDLETARACIKRLQTEKEQLLTELQWHANEWHCEKVRAELCKEEARAENAWKAMQRAQAARKEAQ